MREEEERRGMEMKREERGGNPEAHTSLMVVVVAVVASVTADTVDIRRLIKSGRSVCLIVVSTLVHTCI